MTSVSGEGTSGGAPSLDADAADIDGDGDYDVLIAEDNNSANKVLINITNTPDTHAPYIPNVENPGNQTASTGVVPVRAQVYDNAPYYITWYNPTQVNVSVDGCDIGPITAHTSQGQIFRAEIPANLVGAVSLEWQSEDEYGNTGFSSAVNYTGSTGLGFTSKYGTSTNSVSTGSAPSFDVLSVPFGGTTAYLAARGGAGVAYLMAIYDSSSAPLPLPGLLVANIGGGEVLTLSGTLDSSGCRVTAIPLNAGIAAGATVYGQVFTFDGATNGDLLASSQGTTLTTQ
jgi:hypothetical protein